MKRHVISLFDFTGNMVKPWQDNGYECWIVDLQHEERHEKTLHAIRHDLSEHWLCPVDSKDIAFVAAFPPCDHLAVSGARWFAGKGLRLLAESIKLFAVAAEFCEWSGAPYMIENPVSTISTYWRKPDFSFEPHWFTGYEAADNYHKKTCLWTGGGFVMPEVNVLGGLMPPDNRIHRCPPSDERKNIRSATPMGFAKAVFEANKNQQVQRRMAV